MPSIFHKNLLSYNLSAVIILLTKYLPTRKKKALSTISHNIATTLITVNAEMEMDKRENNRSVIPKILTIVLIVMERPTIYQKVGLASIVE